MSTTPFRESRVKKTLLNARVNLIFYFVSLFLSFYSRKIFFDYLGADFLGLTGTLQNILGFLNLAELGIGGAILFLLYKPLYNHDEEEITGIISVMGFFYNRIGWLILGLGLVISIFFPFIFPENHTDLPFLLVYFTYYVFLTNTVIGYFINYRMILLGADQRYYVVTAYFQTSQLARVCIQMAVAYWTKNLYLWGLIELCFGVIFAIILNWRIRKTYPWLKANVRLGRKLFKKYPEVIKKTKQIFFHKMGEFVQSQTLPIIIYSFTTLTLVAYYQNYTTITSRIRQFFRNLFDGMGASIGNLIAEGDINKIMKVFWEIFSLNFFIAGLVCVPIYLLIDPFIEIWLGKEYILSHLTLILILIPVFIGCIRGDIDAYNAGYGFFWDIWSPIVESALLIGVSVGCGYFWGLNGVLCGPIAALFFVIMLWKPYLLFHWGFKKSVWLYWLQYFRNLICVALPALATYFIANYLYFKKMTNFFEWIGYAIPVFLTYAVLSYLVFLVFSDGMKALNKRIINLLKKIFKIV